MSSSSTDQTTKKRDLLPLLDIHGHERIHVNQCLPNGDALTKFLKDLCYNQNKALYITKTSSGKSKTYKCPDPDCQWQVRGYRAVDKVVGPHFVVSFVNDVHRDICPSSTTPSGRQLTLLSSFKSAMTSDPKMKMKTLKNQVRLSGGVKGCSDSKVYRAMASARKESEPDLQRSYEKIPALLQEIEEKNPGTYKLVDVDQHGRFLRAFLAIGVCVSSQDSLIPLFGFDGTHSKNANYNGHLLTLVGRDGNNQNVPLALVLAHTENQDNITWFLGACQRAGISFDKRPLLCDRGHIRGAAAKIHREGTGWFDLRFCTVHILRNIRAQFTIKRIVPSNTQEQPNEKNPFGQRFEHAVWRLQALETKEELTRPSRCSRAPTVMTSLHTLRASTLVAGLYMRA